MKTTTAFIALAASLSLVSCSGSDSAPKTETQTETSGTTVDSRANAILAKMTVEEKVGQVIQADIAAVTPQEAKDYNLGSVLNGGNSAPGGGKIATPEAWIALADEFWAASTDTSDGGVGVALLWGTDAVHGHNNLQSATIFPHNIGLGAANDAELLHEIGDVTAREIRATGLDWTFAPTLAVAQDDRWGRAYESYSERPDVVARYSKAMVEGLQGTQGTDSFLTGDNVIATAKHFVADGGTQYGIDKGDAIGDDAAILALHGAGYPPAINAGVQTVMSSFSSINGKKMHGSKYLLTDVLRGQMGFDGFVVGDWNGHGEIPGCTVTDCPESLIAGVDMYMAPDSWRGLYVSLLAQAKSGEVPMARLDEAVTRILKVKIRSGLLDGGAPSTRASTDTSLLGADAHSDVARRAVRQSLVLLKNKNNVLPLSSTSNVLVTGSGADSMQQQTGGWTLNWQGDGNPNSIFETGETIYSGLKTALEANGGSATLSEDGSFTKTPDMAIVVFGEQPYAEFFGDRNDLAFEFADGENLKLLKSFQDKNIPVISIFLTGRPLWVNPHLNASDAFVVGWLPGTEAGGIADVLVADTSGAARHDFTGRLTFTWPAIGTGLPQNGESDTDVLFAYGAGLSYGMDGTLAQLSETSGVEMDTVFAGNIMTYGKASNAFTFWLGDSSNLNTPVASLVSSSLGGTIQTRGVDYKAQEDSRQITWTDEAILSVRSARPVDLTQAAGDALTFTWRVDAQPEGDFSVEIQCGDGCTGKLDMAETLAAAPLGEWTTTQIPLSCFTEAGLNPTTVTTPLMITSEKAAQITIYDVAMTAANDTAIACPIAK